MHHYRKTSRVYTRLNVKDKVLTGCTLCMATNVSQVTYENETMYVMPNRVAYDMFEGYKVLDHLMVIPKRHVMSLNELTDREKIDQMTIIGEHEAKDYNVYARAVNSAARSVKHQHTHLIRLADKHAKFMVFLQRPHFLIDG